jgi:hypothetical protein
MRRWEDEKVRGTMEAESSTRSETQSVERRFRSQGLIHASEMMQPLEAYGTAKSAHNSPSSAAFLANSTAGPPGLKHAGQSTEFLPRSRDIGREVLRIWFFAWLERRVSSRSCWHTKAEFGITFQSIPVPMHNLCFGPASLGRLHETSPYWKAKDPVIWR